MAILSKKVLILAIAALLLTLTITVTVHAWSAYASCGRRGNSDDGETYSDAYASSYGLEDGSVSATASVGNYRDTETVNFNANSVVVSAHESGSFNESGTASASTSGWYTTTDSNGDEIRVWKSKSKRDTIGPP